MKVVLPHLSRPSMMMSWGSKCFMVGCLLEVLIVFIYGEAWMRSGMFFVSYDILYGFDKVFPEMTSRIDMDLCIPFTN